MGRRPQFHVVLLDTCDKTHHCPVTGSETPATKELGMGTSSKAEWEKAAHLAGLTLCEEPVCEECCGEGVVRNSRGYSGLCPVCAGEFRPSCAATGEDFAPGEMAWTTGLGYRRPVSVAAVIACEDCGNHPRVPGETVCSTCLEGAATQRTPAAWQSHVDVIDGAMGRLLGGAL